MSSVDVEASLLKELQAVQTELRKHHQTLRFPLRADHDTTRSVCNLKQQSVTDAPVLFSGVYVVYP